MNHGLVLIFHETVFVNLILFWTILQPTQPYVLRNVDNFVIQNVIFCILANTKVDMKNLLF